MEKLTFDKIMKKYEEVISKEYNENSFCAYYITDNNCVEAPYKLKCLYLHLFYPADRNLNKKYEFNNSVKENFKNLLIDIFNKENIYSLII